MKKGGFRYLVHPIYDWKAAYAKWFSREYLQQENLSFHPELKLFEDTYLLAYLVSSQKIFIILIVLSIAGFITKTHLSVKMANHLNIKRPFEQKKSFCFTSDSGKTTRKS
ncbi:hypothetical protein ICE98_00433 [Lactococcus lactis]|nr:hypothetical protein [Lactococcus lactis]